MNLIECLTTEFAPRVAELVRSGWRSDGEDGTVVALLLSLDAGGEVGDRRWVAVRNESDKSPTFALRALCQRERVAAVCLAGYVDNGAPMLRAETRGTVTTCTLDGDAVAHLRDYSGSTNGVFPRGPLVGVLCEPPEWVVFKPAVASA